MRKKLFLAGAFAFSTLFFDLHAQTPRNPLPRSINIPSKNHISPSLSGDGKSMVFVSNYTTSGKMLLKYSTLDERGQWTEPEELHNINREGYDFIGGHWLSYDGRLLFFTSKRGPTIGGYDIFFSERKGSYWTPPQNIGKPINSDAAEGHPSLTPDGRYLYFMRCRDMDNTSASGCELYVAERKSETYWNEPVRLPYPVNTGDEATPRIMADGVTLMFASKRPGGKGGYDIYQAQNRNGSWTQPVACYYLNTERDDQYVSVPGHGQLAYFSTLFRGYFNIIVAQIPDELKPNRVAMIQGALLDAASGKPLEGVVQVYNARTKERDQFIKTNPDGSFLAMIRADGVYDFSVMSRENRHVYFSRLYDLTALEHSIVEDREIKASPVQSGVSFVDEAIQFEPYSAQIKKESEVALLRLIKLLKDNRGIRIEIGAHIDEYRADSIPSDPELTEVIVDTVFIEPPAPLPFEDSADMFLETAEAVDEITYDATVTEPALPDTLTIEPRKLYELKYTYHNDRTEKQAQAVREKLIDMGAPAYLIEARGYGDSRPLEPNASEENRRKNRRIEIRIIK